MEETLTIDTVCPKGDIYPMVVDFQNGLPNEDFDINCEVFQNDEGIKTIVTEVSDLLYAGDEESEDLGQKLMLLVRNRKTGKVRLIEAGYAELKPVLKSDLDTSQHLENNTLELSRKFGSKKQKQQMEHREKLNVNIQTVTEQMEKVTENITEDKLDLTDYDKGDSDAFYIPPIDRSATKVEDVYALNKLLTEEQYDTIYSELESKDYTTDMNPWIKSIVESKKLNPHLTVLAVYADALLKYSNLKAVEIKKKNFAACQISMELNKVILGTFSTLTNGKLNRPIQYKDKCTCYFIVLMLILNNFKFEIEPLATALKMTPNTVGLKVRVVGGSVATVGSKKMVQLKVPLPKKTVMRRKSSKF